jgi:YD repeat-containing protein
MRERVDGQAGTGELGSSSAGVLARVSYAANYYDAADRFVASADVGTNGGALWTRPTGIPAASDTMLISTTAYDAAGRPWSWTSPKGTITQATYDVAGRTTALIEAAGTSLAHTTSLNYNSSGQLVTVTAPGNRTTGFGYDTWGRMINTTERVGTSFARTSAVSLNQLGEAVSATDSTGVVTKLQYDIMSLGGPVNGGSAT